MVLIFLLLALLAAMTDWFAVRRRWRPLEYAAKPGVMVFLLVFAWAGGRPSNPLILLGILFSLAGDVFLMFSPRWFLAGLVAFLLAHAAYIAALNSAPPALNIFSLAMTAFIGVLLVRIDRKIAAGLAAKGRSRLRVPALIYSITISIMLLSALNTLFNLEWAAPAALMVSAGAALFYASDVVLGWDRFVSPIKNGRMINLVSYHLGQIVLVAGISVQFAFYH